MYQLVFKPRAILMQKDAYDWYESQRNGLGELFLIELDTCYQKIVTAPSHYSKINNNYRQYILKTFPYVIVFRVIDQTIVVYAVFHTSRDPKHKFKD